MKFSEVETIVLEILKNANGKYLLPYQVFMRLKDKNPSLAHRIEEEYPVQEGNPSMGEGAGIHYSPASFIAHALSHFKNKLGGLDQQWFDSSDIEVEGIIPGNKEGTSIWAWQSDK